MKIDITVEKETTTENAPEKEKQVFEVHVKMNEDLFNSLIASALATRLMSMSTLTEKAVP